MSMSRSNYWEIDQNLLKQVLDSLQDEMNHVKSAFTPPQPRVGAAPMPGAAPIPGAAPMPGVAPMPGGGMPMDPSLMGMMGGMQAAPLPPGGGDIGIPPDILAMLGPSNDTSQSQSGVSASLPGAGESTRDRSDTGDASNNRIMDMSSDEFKSVVMDAVEKAMESSTSQIVKVLEDILDVLKSTQARPSNLQ